MCGIETSAQRKKIRSSNGIMRRILDSKAGSRTGGRLKKPRRGFSL